MKTHPRSTRGFTLVELLLVVLVVFLLLALLMGGFRFARGFSRKAADRTTLSTLKQNVAFFQDQLGFLPPLVKDMGSPQGGGPNYTFPGDPPVRLVGNQNMVQAYSLGVADELRFLRTSPPADQPDMRFSIYSLPYYLIGACETELFQSPPANLSQTTIDGVPGPGMFAPTRDGQFERSGRRFEPFFDVSRNTRALVAYTLPTDPPQAAGSRVELRDSQGIAFRYYRWEPGKRTNNANTIPGPMGSVMEPADLNIPLILGDPAENPALKDAKYALLAAGPNGLFGNEHQLNPSHPQALTLDQMAAKLGMATPAPNSTEYFRLIERAMEDNVMEVGK